MAVPQGFFVTDLDGTLATNVTATVDEGDRRALAALGEWGVIRVVATGRSLESLRRVLPPSFPVDYVVFSTGAGVARWPDGEILLARNLEGDALGAIAHELDRLGADFMAHDPVPDNQHFRWHRRSATNVDFARRLERHAHCCRPWDPADLPRSASQFLVIDAVAGSSLLHEAIEARLSAYAVTRATSPLDGITTWTEIFAAGVTKGSGCAWLAERLGLPDGTPRVAVGNDYNDMALLQWSSLAFVTADAPVAVRHMGETVPVAGQGAVRRAIAQAFAFLPGVADALR